MIYPVDSVDSPFEQLVLRSLWIFTRSSKDACADLQGPLKILKSFSPESKYPIKIKVYKVVRTKISDFTPV